MNNKTKQFYKECKYDLGGYFIINGSEKVIVSQERMLKIKFMYSKLIKILQNIHKFVKLNQLI